MIKTFINRPVFTTMFILVFVVFGLWSYPKLGVDLYPDVDLPLVAVTVTYEGTAPEEMETLVTKPIENRISQVSGIKTITSTIREGYSQTVLEFEIGTDPRQMASEVREKVAGVRKRLPDDIDEPVVARFDSASSPVATYSFSSDTRSTGEIRRLLNDSVVDRLQMVEGVADVNVHGASDRAVKVHVNSEKLKAYGISFQTILAKVNNANLNTPGGKIRDDHNTITVRTMGKFNTIDDFKNIVVANINGKPVYLTDVADVEDAWEDEETYSRTNGVPSVLMSVRKQSRTNTVNVIDSVNEELSAIEKSDLPPDIKVNIINDQSLFICENVGDVWNTIIFGGFLALLITYLFLGDLRATIIGGLAIPVSVISTFFLMRTLDFTMNNMSLMGLSLAVGFLIDDAIVLVENIFRHMELGKRPKIASADATKELMLAILATSMSLLAVFVPIGSMGETIGQYFKQFGLTVACAVVFSTICAYTLTPMLSAYWLKLPDVSTKGRPRIVSMILRKFNFGFERIRLVYNRFMMYAVERPWKIVLIAVATLGFNLLLIPFVGTELQPVYDSGEFRVNLKAPPGVGLLQMEEWSKPLEETILEEPEVRVSSMWLGGTRTPVNEGGINIKLKPLDERDRSMTEIMADLRKKFSDIGTMQVGVVTNQGGRNDPRPVQIGLRGSDLKKLTGYANDLAERIRQVPGATDVEVVGISPEPEIVVRLNQLKASQLGLDNTEVGKVVQYAFQGKSTSHSYTIGNDDYDIILQMGKDDRRTLSDVQNLRVSTTNGTFVRLGDIADVTLSSGPTRIGREGRQRQIAVYANAAGISSGELLSEIQNKIIPDMNMEIGYNYKLIGDSDMMGRVFKEIAKAVILAIILIYMVLGAEFESFRQPLVIMMSLPFAVIGAVLALLLANQTANMMSLIGFTMLLGLVTKNAILLVDYANQARDRGKDVKSAILEACSLRLRPICMTTLSTILGMLPVALGLGAGAELRQSMGLVLIGGLTTSTLLTLVVVPLIYLLTERHTKRNLSDESTNPQTQNG
jgi:hydrophobe/amphiphile efflux-1 (HAE1) family protein